MRLSPPISFAAVTFQELHPDQGWLTVAIEFGYSDYDHFARDVTQFAKFTPHLMLKEYGQPSEFMVKV